MKTIALLTDFGHDDIYVGVMKGVMRGLCRDADFIDITHTVAPQHVREAAFALVNAYRFFPSGTVFLVVVDPGVGSTRRAIAVESGDYYFVAPDNGVLCYTLRGLGDHRAVELTNPRYHLPRISHTFNGRDIFAPVAAHLASGERLGSLGDPVTDLVQMPLPFLEIKERVVQGEVLHIDRFGNIVTSIGRVEWVDAERITLTSRFAGASSPIPIYAPSARIQINGDVITGVYRTYSDVRRGEALALVGSSAHLEISVSQGNAARRFDVAVGDRIDLILGSE